MKKRLLLPMLLLAASALSAQEMDWKRFERMFDNGEYTNVYTQAKAVFDGRGDGSRRLEAAYWMAQAAARYQEDARDSAEARYRSLLPDLDALHRSLCYAFLGQYDSALLATEVLQRTPVAAIEHYCNSAKGENATPTAYDVIVIRMMESGSLNDGEMVMWQRRLCDFHRTDADDIRIFHENRLLRFLDNWPNHTLPYDSIRACINRYRGTKSQEITRLYYFMASRMEREGRYVEALAYCDTALRLAPKSKGGIECFNLSAQIKQVLVNIMSGLVVAPATPGLMEVAYRNAGHLWFRIVPYFKDYEWDDDVKRQMLKAKPLQQWDLEVPSNSEYLQEHCYVALPALAAGHYLLMVSPTSDFKKHGFMGYDIHCTDMQLVKNNNEGLLLDCRSGLPIVGQEVKLVKGKYRDKRKDVEVVATARTDRDGRYRFDIESRWDYEVVVERDGYLLENGYYHQGKLGNKWENRCELRTDRPIYKPGDTLHVAVMRYSTDGLDALAVNNLHLKVVLKDPNGKEVASDSLVTDEFGMAEAVFVLPTDRLPGRYRVNVIDGERIAGTVTVRVEEYKQPKFTVTLNSANNDATKAAFGEPYTLGGMAASYTSVPIAGAQVKYTVVRTRMHRRWWCYGGTGAVEVAAGETTTTTDGSFEITFVPEPDSSVDLGLNPCFEYRVNVDVTDINGESHPANTTVRVGFRNAFLALEGKEEVRSLKGLKPRYFDLNGNPLTGKVEMKVERLRQPSVPLLDPEGFSSSNHVKQTLSEADYRKAFPLFAYDRDYNDRDKWKAVDQWLVAVGGEADDKLPTASGVYRITLAAEGADTVVAYRVVTADDARKVQSQQLLWYDIDKTVAEVGDTVTLRFGTRFNDIEVYYLLRVGDKELDFRRMSVSNQLKTIRVVVDSTMLGGFNITLITVREGEEKYLRARVDVPFLHKKLEVEIASFRDRLQPGETEEWTIRVRGERSKANESAALVMTLYDDALNSYGEATKWDFSPWRENVFISFSFFYPYVGTLWNMEYAQYEHYKGTNLGVWRLRDAMPRRQLRKYAAAKMLSATARGESDEVPVIEIGTAESGQRMTSDDIARMPGNSVESIVAAVGGIGYDDGAEVEELEEVVLSMAEEEPEREEPQIRTNLNPLAFFATGLRTDSSGTVTFRFTVPELLTRWNLRGLAVTKDVKTGTIERTLVTSKSLMVQPNMPRFLRHGDSVMLMAKVMNLSDVERRVKVSFRLSNMYSYNYGNRYEQVEVVPAKGSVQVAIPIDDLPDDLYVATYSIVAQTVDNDIYPSFSDGERGQIPVISNRQAVSVSKAFYINGAGEKSFTFPLSTFTSPTAEPLLLAAELTDNPIWLALKSMPYLKELESPSTLYLANRMYVNTLGKELVGQIGHEKLVELVEQENESPLGLNEDVKQTLLQATPWVRAAENEREQRQALRHYLDSVALDAELAKMNAELAARQNADGGWSWMPEGTSSVWATQQVLKRLSILKQSNNQAIQQSLAYIDREHQRDYERYVKPYLLKRWLGGASDIDYLYTRSFYGKGKTEAYKYYYSNALKSYKDYENLYTQAQLALIFYRNGDRKPALDLLRRVKQKSLVSDEMGLYWRDNRGGWWWYERPIEVQALMIQAFAEITPQDTATIALMQQWLLKQKQTTHWGNDRATTEAIAALMVGKARQKEQTGQSRLTVLGVPMTADAQGLEGYQSQRWTGATLDSIIASNDSTIVLSEKSAGIAWGAVYYQYADDIDKIAASEMGISLKRSYINLSNQKNQGDLKVGDRLKVCIEITCDRAMDYLELIDGRPSSFEPLSTRAGWRWNEGMAYYVTVNNTDTRCYVEHIEKGKYVFEYEVYVTNPGRFLCGPVTMQCMYAPEFRATAPAQRLVVE